MNVRLDVHDLPEYGLHIISPVDPSFKGMMSAYFQDKRQDTLDLFQPFSVFVKNTSKRHAVAYTLKWELIRADGKVLTHISSYATPEILMGYNMPDDTSAKTKTHILKSGAIRYFTWNTSVGSDFNDSIGIISGGSQNPNNANEVKRAGRERDKAALLNQLNNELTQATNLTVSIDGAFMDDGTFVGPNTTNFFEQIKAQVDAHHDLLNSVVAAVQNDKELDNVFNSMQAQSGTLDALPNGASTPAEHYNFYLKVYGREFAGMRDAYGKNKATEYLLNLNARSRKLKKQS